MLQTFEAVIDEQGHVRLLEPIELPTGWRVLVTILMNQSSMFLKRRYQVNQHLLRTGTDPRRMKHGHTTYS